MRSAQVRHDDPGVRRAKAIARLLDDRYVDPILGLVLPGAGDIVSSAFGLYIIGVAIDRGLPAVVIARMLVNLALDSTIGAIPILGDLFDFVYKANRRNVDLLTRRHISRKSSPGDWLFVVAAIVAAGLAILMPIFIVASLIAWIF